MKIRARPRSAPAWAFWLLLSAWACASTPQFATFTALTWLVEGRSFSHQQRLKRDVQRLLAGQPAATPIADAASRTQQNVPDRKSTPIASDALQKRIELSLETTSEVLPAASLAGWPLGTEGATPNVRRGEPLLRPPRAKAA